MNTEKIDMHAQSWLEILLQRETRGGLSCRMPRLACQDKAGIQLVVALLRQGSRTALRVIVLFAASVRPSVLRILSN